MRVCALIVTYGNRFHLLKQVVDSALAVGVEKVIVVDNNSASESREKLKEYEKELGSKRIKVLYLDDNYGSAGGYKRGLEEAYKCKDCEFIWLLDDDNKPKAGALQVLFDFWNNLNESLKEEKVALLAFREDRELYKEALLRNDPNLVLGRKNSFLGFHILDLPRKIMKRLRKKIKLYFDNSLNKKYGLVSVGTYGGMFFHKKLLSKIDYPNEKFFLYADDHEWSYRITKMGGKIYLVLNSYLEDIDKSWHLEDKYENKTIFYKILNCGADFRIYYSTRNRVYFELKEMVNSKFVYKINRLVFNIMLNFLKNNENSKRKRIFDLAVKDGLWGRLGKNENFNL